MPISTLDELRALYPPVLERARLKTQYRLDKHCRAFIEKSPFLTLSTQGPQGADVTPRGDAPGFVHILDDTTIAIPDWRGNNRLDSLTNILSNPKVGLLFFIPGILETLRVNGEAEITAEAEVLNRWTVNNNHPATALLIEVKEAYLHCGKALIRSKLWQDDYKAEMPTYGAMMKDQIDVRETAADNDRGMRLLHWLRPTPHRLDIDELATILRDLVGPDRLDGADALAHQCEASLKCRTVVAHLLDVPAAADTKDHAPAAQVIKRRDLFGRVDRIALDDEADAGRELDALGRRGSRRSKRPSRAAARRWGKAPAVRCAASCRPTARPPKRSWRSSRRCRRSGWSCG